MNRKEKAQWLVDFYQQVADGRVGMVKTTTKMYAEDVVLVIDGATHGVEVHFHYWPGIPAQTNGPMENCYPEEPEEFEIMTLIANNKDVTYLMDEEGVADSIEAQLTGREEEEWEC